MRLLGASSVDELNARHVRPFKTSGSLIDTRNADPAQINTSRLTHVLFDEGISLGKSLGAVAPKL